MRPQQRNALAVQQGRFAVGDPRARGHDAPAALRDGSSAFVGPIARKKGYLPRPEDGPRVSASIVSIGGPYGWLPPWLPDRAMPGPTPGARHLTEPDLQCLGRATS